MLSKDAFTEYGADGFNRIPLAVRVETADGLDPETVYRRLAGRRDDFLFETGGYVDGRFRRHYSYVGLPAAERIEITGKRFAVFRGDEAVLDETVDDPLARLAAYHAAVRVPRLDGVPSFAGGLFGYFGFETVRLIERRLDRLPRKPAPLAMPDIALLVADDLVVFDHEQGDVVCVVYASAGDDDAYDKAVGRLEDIAAEVRTLRPASRPDLPDRASEALPEPTYHFPKSQYEQGVERIKDYVEAGDIMQVVLAQRMTRETTARPLDLYRALTAINPSPYAYLLNLGDRHVVGASPEMLVRSEQGTVDSRPMAGTRRRGRTEAEDRALEEELLADPKEVAEHVMLIDLARHDIGRIATIGSVRVAEKMIVERFSHVMHITSTVRGTLPLETSPIDVIKGTLPAGTLSGASKVRALEIINELEPQSRGVYGGGIGWIAWSGDVDLAITIRTAVLGDGVAQIQAGAGIVADSRPEREWQETLDKSRVIATALAIAERQAGGDERHLLAS